MEAASVAWAAALSNTPFFGVKVVTDIVDGDRPTHDEFLENLGAAARKLQEVLPNVISYVMGKKLADL
jgi:5'-methylthioadenosine nucleosidase